MTDLDDFAREAAGDKKLQEAYLAATDWSTTMAEIVWGVQVKCKGKTTWFTTLARGPWDARRKILQWIGLEASDTPYRVLQVRGKPYG